MVILKSLKINFSIVTLFLTISSLAQDEMKVVEKIVGVVGEEIILLSEHRVQKSDMISRGLVGDNLDCAVMENLLFEKLLLNQAKIDSIEIQDEFVESELENRMSYFSQQLGGDDKLEEFYGKSIEQIKSEFRDLLKDQMLSQRMQSNLTADVHITPADVEEYFNGIPADSLPLISSEVQIAHIVKKPEPRAEEKRKVKDRLNQLRDEIIEGKDFGAMASLYSDDPGSKLQGGELGLVGRGVMVPEFEATAYNLELGEVSRVFETDFGYHIMQLVERRGDLYNCRHILMIPKISNEDLNTARNDLDSIRVLVETDSLTFGRAAERFSDDEDSRYSGGVIINPQTRSLRFAVQEVDPQIFFVIDKQEVGEVSDPVLMTYPDGSQAYRIIKLIERTDPHRANLSEDYQLLQEMARNDLSQKSIDDWVNSAVNRTYIKVDDAFNSCTFDYGWKKSSN